MIKLTPRQTEIIEAMREWPVMPLYLPNGITRIENKFKIGNLFVDKYILERLKKMGIIIMGENDKSPGKYTYILADSHTDDLTISV